MIYILQKSLRRAQNNQQIEINLGLVCICQKIYARHVHNLIFCERPIQSRKLENTKVRTIKREVDNKFDV